MYVYYQPHNCNKLGFSRVFAPEPHPVGSYAPPPPPVPDAPLHVHHQLNENSSSTFLYYNPFLAQKPKFVSLRC